MNPVALLTLMLLAPEAGDAAARPLAEIHLRDPFILPVKEERRYYLFGTGWALPGGPGFMVYTSTDLKTWHGPRSAFQQPEGFRSEDHWAPEVHRHRGRYYLLGTLRPQGEGRRRGTWVLVSDRPGGPYRFHSRGPVTPEEWWCLDGTLYRDRRGAPWMVFCREWVEVGDGQMVAVRLSSDLSRAQGEPVLLFRASEAPWVVEIGEQPRGRVTDGPFLHRAAGGALWMLWSSFGAGGYKTAVARSPSGDIRGPWVHEPKPIYEEDGGHGMVFRTFEGRLMLTLHQPNSGGRERPRLFAVEEKADGLVLSPWGH